MPGLSWIEQDRRHDSAVKVQPVFFEFAVKRSLGNPQFFRDDPAIAKLFQEFLNTQFFVSCQAEVALALQFRSGRIICTAAELSLGETRHAAACLITAAASITRGARFCIARSGIDWLLRATVYKRKVCLSAGAAGRVIEADFLSLWCLPAFPAAGREGFFATALPSPLRRSVYLFRPPPHGISSD